MDVYGNLDALNGNLCLFNGNLGAMQKQPFAVIIGKLPCFYLLDSKLIFFAG